MKMTGFAAALAAALLALPMLATPAFAADPKLPVPTKQQFEKGAKDGPVVVTASGVACTPDQIVWHGGGKDKVNPKVDVNAYEASCKEGLGYVFIQNSDQPKPTSYDCFTAIGSPQACFLPGNADPKMGLAMRAATLGRTCAVKDARYIGTSTSTGASYYELACQAGAGFRLTLAADKVEATDCLALIDSPNECKLTSRAEASSSLAPALAASGKTCPLKEARFVGTAAGGETYYEVACSDGPGFMLAVDDKLGFKRAIDCSKAQGLGGGCKLTDTVVAETADIAAYTKLAAKAGYPCQVAKYRFIGTDKQNREVVEVACTNRPDGALALFADGAGKSEILDCVRAGSLAQECRLSSPSAVYGKYTAVLASKGKTSCKVSGARFIGTNEKGDYIETACSDGLPGWVITLVPGTDTATDLLACKQAAGTGLQCKLPGNG